MGTPPPAPNAAMLKPFTTSLIASPKSESIHTRSRDETSSGCFKTFEKRDRNCGNSTSRTIALRGYYPEFRSEFFPPEILSPRYIPLIHRGAAGAKRPASCAIGRHCRATFLI